jgi:hypothetical protein
LIVRRFEVQQWQCRDDTQLITQPPSQSCRQTVSSCSSRSFRMLDVWAHVRNHSAAAAGFRVGQQREPRSDCGTAVQVKQQRLLRTC